MIVPCNKPKVAVISTGGTICGLGSSRLDFHDYAITGRFMHVDELLDGLPELAEVAEVVPVPYVNTDSTAIGAKEWLELAALVEATAIRIPDLAGIVITHGTASLEETAYFLNLTVTARVTVVLVGAMRPASALGADGGLNLLNAVRVAVAPDTRDLGVLVVLNDEIHAARDVIKAANFHVHTFRSPDFGMLGYADADNIEIYRKPVRCTAPHTEFKTTGINELPRVDIIPAYGGADDVLVEAAVAAGAKGLVSAGFPAGTPSPQQRQALERAVNSGVIVVQSSRAGSGRVAPRSIALRRAGFIGADTLVPQKARILLMLALTQTVERACIKSIFATY